VEPVPVRQVHPEMPLRGEAHAVACAGGEVVHGREVGGEVGGGCWRAAAGAAGWRGVGGSVVGGIGIVGGVVGWCCRGWWWLLLVLEMQSFFELIDCWT
jgi:hypothetical protein